MTVEILILAAGSSSRMRGADKLLEPVEGIALLRRLALTALETSLKVTVALPPDRPARKAALIDLPLNLVTVPHPERGMAESLKAGLAALPHAAPVLLLLADLPEITAADLTGCLTAWAETPDMILRGTAEDGKPGHPVGLPGWLRTEVMDLTGDQGAREVLARHPDRVRLIPLPGQHATTDLDTPEDWAAWRATRARNL